MFLYDEAAGATEVFARRLAFRLVLVSYAGEIKPCFRGRWEGLSDALRLILSRQDLPMRP